jgi:4-amino-4-deoxy-L-arabinose transferase-like glycosyltransferase
MAEAIMHHSTNLLLLAVLIFLAAGIGHLLLIKSRVSFTSFLESVVFAAGVGFGILSLSVFSLCALQILSPASVWMLLAAHVAPAVWGWRLSLAFSGDASLSGIRIEGLDRWAFLLLLILIGASLMMMLTPSFSTDALSYHLAIPKQYLAHGGFLFIPGNIFSNYPLGGEMLFLVGLVFKGDVLAKGIHFAMALLTLAAMWVLIRRYLPEKTPRILPLLVFLSIPSVWLTSTLAYTDLFLAAYTFLALTAFITWCLQKQTAWLILCAVMTGLAVGSKYVGVFLPFLGCLAVLAADYRNRTPTSGTLAHLGIFLLVTVSVGTPFYIKNWALTGNPLYPFFYGVFGGKGWSADQARLYDLFLQHLGMGRRWIDYLLLPWNISFKARMHSAQFDGVLGPVFILTLPFLVCIRKIPWAVKVLLVYAGSTFLFWAVSAQQIRYLIPVFPPLAVAVGYVIGCFRNRKPIFVLLMLLVSIGVCVNGYSVSTELAKIKPYRYLTGKENREAFLSRVIPAYPMFRYINTKLPADAKIFFIYMRNLGYLCDRAYYSDSIIESYTIQQILGRPQAPEAAHRFLREQGFTHVLYDGNYVIGPESALTEFQKHGFLEFRDRFLSQLKTEKGRYFLYRIQ